MVDNLWRQGRLSDFHAGALKSAYESKRALCGAGALVVAGIWLYTLKTTDAWLLIGMTTIGLGLLFLLLLHRFTLLEHAIAKVSQRSSSTMDQFLDEFLEPYPELHQIFVSWRAEGPLWRHDEMRLVNAGHAARVFLRE